MEKMNWSHYFRTVNVCLRLHVCFAVCYTIIIFCRLPCTVQYAVELNDALQEEEKILQEKCKLVSCDGAASRV